MARRIGEHAALLPLIQLVICLVGGDGVSAPPIRIGHGLRGDRPPLSRDAGGRVGIEPVDMLLAGVGATEAVLELLAEGHAQLAQPLVVAQTLSHPDGAGMPRIADGEVAVLRGVAGKGGGGGEIWFVAGRGGQEPVGGIEQLGCLQDHLDDVLVTVPARAARRLMGQIEDVHFARKVRA